ncbi:MAG TPA: hypothetical protein VGP68_16105 [Gemmataceae bacterium]|jgi:hypothetical protein|nr:hypothetical protein [Gemmataceae bacterium]
MPRYLVSTRRANRGSAVSARDAVADEPGVILVNSNDPHMVTIETSNDVAKRLQTKLKDTCFVEPEIRRGPT